MTEQERQAARSRIRKEKKQARSSLSPEQREEYSARAVERLAQSPLFRRARTVMIYSHMGAELSLDSLPAHPAAAGKRFCYPLCVSPTEMIAMPGAYGCLRFGGVQRFGYDLNGKQLLFDELSKTVSDAPLLLGYQTRREGQPPFAQVFGRIGAKEHLHRQGIGPIADESAH